MKKTIISTKQDRQWQGIPGIEISKNGRFWATFYSGGDKEPHTDNFILITTSTDGKNWSNPEIVMERDKDTRVFDPTLWHDPDGKLWLIFNQASIKNKDYTVWAITTENSDEEHPTWSEPFKLDFHVPFSFRMNKPIVTSDNRWMLPVTWTNFIPTGSWMGYRKELQGVAISKDKGKTWKLFGEVKAKPWALENMIIELKNQKYKYWMLIRSGSGKLFQSFSNDGETWTKGKKSKIINCGSRFYIGRLQSGKILLINNLNKRGRKGIYAAISNDGGKKFPNKLILDTREKVSYPDMVQDNRGNIHLVYDRDRYGVGEINKIELKEEEILNSIS